MTHPAIPQELLDSANRMRDAVNLHVVAGALGARARHLCWVAIRLEDGRSDGNLYESRLDAVNHTQNKSPGWTYVLIGADSMSEREALLVLQMHRKAYAMGVRFSEEHVVVPQMTELMAPFLPNTLRKLGTR